MKKIFILVFNSQIYSNCQTIVSSGIFIALFVLFDLNQVLANERSARAEEIDPSVLSLLNAAKGLTGRVNRHETCDAASERKQLDPIFECVRLKNLKYLKSNETRIEEEIEQLNQQKKDLLSGKETSPLNYTQWLPSEIDSKIEKKKQALNIFQSAIFLLECPDIHLKKDEVPVFENSEQVYRFVSGSVDEKKYFSKLIKRSKVWRPNAYSKMPNRDWMKGSDDSSHYDSFLRSAWLTTKDSNYHSQNKLDAMERDRGVLSGADEDEALEVLKDFLINSEIKKTRTGSIQANDSRIQINPDPPTPPQFYLLVDHPDLVDLATKYGKAFREMLSQNPELGRKYSEQMNFTRAELKSMDMNPDKKSSLFPNSNLTRAMVFELEQSVDGVSKTKTQQKEYAKQLTDGLSQNANDIRLMKKKLHTEFTKSCRIDLREKLSSMEWTKDVDLRVQGYFLDSKSQVLSRLKEHAPELEDSTRNELIQNIDWLDKPQEKKQDVVDGLRQIDMRYSQVQSKYRSQVESISLSGLSMASGLGASDDHLGELQKVFPNESAKFINPQNNSVDLRFLYPDAGSNQEQSKACVGQALTSQAERAFVVDGKVIPGQQLSEAQTYGLLTAGPYVNYDFKSPDLPRRTLLSFAQTHPGIFSEDEIKKASPAEIQEMIQKNMDKGVFPEVLLQTVTQLNSIPLTPVSSNGANEGAILEVPQSISQQNGATYIQEFPVAIFESGKKPGMDQMKRILDQGEPVMVFSEKGGTKTFHEDWVKFEDSGMPGGDAHSFEVIGYEVRTDPFDGKIKPAFLTRDSFCGKNYGACDETYISAEELMPTIVMMGTVKKVRREGTTPSL